MMRVLIVAAYASVRAGLHALLSEIEGISVSGYASGSAELDRVLQDNRPDVVLYDDNPADRDRLIEILGEAGIGIVLLTEAAEDFPSQLSVALPGWAALLKDAEGEEIAAALAAAAKGLIVLDRRLVSTLNRLVHVRKTPDAQAGEGLTSREMEVLQEMAKGLPNKNIAARLNVSLHTVKFHVASILSKLGASSRTEAVAIGARRGYVAL